MSEPAVRLSGLVAVGHVTHRVHRRSNSWSLPADTWSDPIRTEPWVRASKTNGSRWVAASSSCCMTETPALTLWREIIDSTAGGFAYGATAVFQTLFFVAMSISRWVSSQAVLSHPLDTIKTRQQVLDIHVKGIVSPSWSPQAMPGMAGHSSGAVLRTTLTQGFAELYRGFLPALTGSVLFRTV